MRRAGARELSMARSKREVNQFKELGNYLEENEGPLKRFTRKCTLSHLLIRITPATLWRMDWLGRDWRKPIKRLVRCVAKFQVIS